MSVNYKFFMIPIKNNETMAEELNKFLRANRIISVDKDFVAQGGASFWAVSIEFISGSNETASSAASKSRVDYREVLSQEDFALFVKLKEWRKKQAIKEATPVYTILNNAHLAAISEKKINTKKGIMSLESVGEERANKYSNDIIVIVNEEIKRLEQLKQTEKKN
ncbi:MAG: HRDC domain-containing protein [Desulfobacterales bacterium]|nr:HRDC domain-containing protein [Desulfobacterales bacterium]